MAEIATHINGLKCKFSMLFSRHEGAPRTIPESVACGTPVIIGDQVIVMSTIKISRVFKNISLIIRT